MREGQKVKRFGRVLLGCSIITLLMSCSSAVEQDFGNSVRQMRQAQQLHPELAANPSAEIVNLNDGQRLEGATEIYRAENSTAETIREDIKVKVGR